VHGTVTPGSKLPDSLVTPGSKLPNSLVTLVYEVTDLMKAFRMYRMKNFKQWFIQRASVNGR
jgi:hypothetical protein